MKIKHIDLINKYVKNNDPLLIKNFLKDYDLKQLNKIICNCNTNKFDLFDFVNLEKIDYIKKLFKIIGNNENYKLNANIKEVRTWKHNKGHITKFHYDGNGINVINLCLSGKKKFILTKPNSQITIPFTNITMLNTAREQKEYIVEKYDLFLIPSYWFHKVIALEDNTQTININFINKNELIDPNNLMKLKLHQFFQTGLTKQKIFDFISDKSINPFVFAIEYIKESILLLLFISVIILMEKKYKIELINKLIILLGALTLIISKKTSGMLDIFYYNFAIQSKLLDFINTKNNIHH